MAGYPFSFARRQRRTEVRGGVFSATPRQGDHGRNCRCKEKIEEERDIQSPDIAQKLFDNTIEQTGTQALAFLSKDSSEGAANIFTGRFASADLLHTLEDAFEGLASSPAVTDLLDRVGQATPAELTDPRCYNIRWLELMNELKPSLERFSTVL